MPESEIYTNAYFYIFFGVNIDSVPAVYLRAMCFWVSRAVVKPQACGS